MARHQPACHMTLPGQTGLQARLVVQLKQIWHTCGLQTNQLCSCYRSCNISSLINAQKVNKNIADLVLGMSHGTYNAEHMNAYLVLTQDCSGHMSATRKKGTGTMPSHDVCSFKKNLHHRCRNGRGHGAMTPSLFGQNCS